MPAKPALIAVSIAGTLALGTAGYFANEWRVCRALEAEFLGTIERQSSDRETRALMGAAGIETKVDQEEQRAHQDLELQLQRIMHERIYSRCGTAAGEAASAKAKDILQDSMRDILNGP